MPFQAGRNRASACFSTGSTSARSAASDRRRSSRSTSASTNSGPPTGSRRGRPADDPSGRNSPSASRPEPTSRRSASVTTAMPRPNRVAGSAATNGPWVRAYRPSSRPSGSSTGVQQRLGDPRRQRRCRARPAGSARRSGRPTAPRRRSAPRSPGAPTPAPPAPRRRRPPSSAGRSRWSSADRESAAGRRSRRDCGPADPRRAVAARPRCRPARSGPAGPAAPARRRARAVRPAASGRR